MKLRQIISAIALATLVASSPAAENQLEARRGRRPPEGCHSAISSNCCVPGYCLCKSGAIYELGPGKDENKCKPPGNFIATKLSDHPEYCC
ncbi:hypothetical protein XA68_10194 [Ophiocordyceps unilateralis]|uniref:Uncharacterized protein n=1 Tax=Ophiocordyceps unilateralis TaxID=268505 RepID=A0A2A9PIL7_OPHUN|nr:hypothetical protein XA68_10194 [Ophiocordyceps unilateralis]